MTIYKKLPFGGQNITTWLILLTIIYIQINFVKCKVSTTSEASTVIQNNYRHNGKNFISRHYYFLFRTHE